jgi:predicted transcriptional regulator
MLRRLGDLSLNLVVAISERDVLAQNEQAERYDGRSMNVHDRRLHRNALLVCSAGVDARAVSDRNYY